MILGLGMLNQTHVRTGTERFETEVGLRLLAHGEWGTWRVYSRGGLPSAAHAHAFEEVLCPPLGRQRGARLWSEQVTWARELGRRPPGLLVTMAFSPPITSRVPCVMTLHDVAPLERPGDYPGFSRLYWERVLRDAVPRAARLATPSTWVKEECSRRLGVPLDRIDVVYSGVRPLFLGQASLPPADRVLERLGVHAPFWLHCGTVQPRKNLEVLVRTLGRLRERRLDVPHLVSVGAPTPHARRILELAARSGVGDRVTLAGTLQDQELATLYRACDAFVYPSWTEGFGLPPVEALAGGAVVIAARASCLPEILGDVPHWADPAEPDSWIASWDAARAEREDARRERIRLGAAWAGRYTWEDTTDRMARAIDRWVRESV